MTVDSVDRRLHGVAIYNPDLLSRQELIAQFAARQELLDHIVDDLHRSGFNQHQVIVGSRGMGKTTLLRRLRYAIEDDPALSSVWLPLTFPEEQYNVGRLSDLYVNFIDALGDALEQSGRRDEAGALDDAVESLPRGDEEKRAEAALDLLLGTAERLDRRLVLLIDNLDLVLERLEKDERAQWAFRELLSHERRLLLIGAMPVIIGATYDYGRPFYDFFRIHELHGLTREETRVVLTRLSRELGAPAVERLLERDPGRIDTLHTLTGGNPRTIVLLFGVLAQGTDGDVRSDLEKLLDQCTPLYKARFEALPAQAQQVVDAVAIHWDPISAGELARKLPIEVNAISAQLNRLVQQGVLEKVEYHPETKIGFQVAERFFNIWYLMRASRRVRRRLIWLVQFLKLFYGADQVKTKARELLGGALRSTSDEKLRHVELCLAIAQLIEDDVPTRYALESHAIRTMLGDHFLSGQIPAMLDLDGEDAALRGVMDREQWVDEFEKALERAKLPAQELERARDLIGGAPWSRQYRLRLADGLRTKTRRAREQQYEELETQKKNLVAFWGQRFTSQLRSALSEGLMDSMRDYDGAALAAELHQFDELDAFSLRHPGKFSSDRLRHLVRSSNSPIARVLLAAALFDEGDHDGARALLSMAQEHEQTGFADLLAGALAEEVGHLEEAATFLKRAIASDPKYAETLRRLGRVQARLGRLDAAVNAFEQALEAEQNVDTFVDYGEALVRIKRFPDAVRAFHDALDKEPNHPVAVRHLVFWLVQLDRAPETLDIVRSVTEASDPQLLLPAAVAFMSNEDEPRAAAFLRAFVEKESGLGLAPAVIGLFALDQPDDAVSALRRLLAVDPDLLLSATPALMPVFGAAVRHGYAADVLQVLDEAELQDALRPAYEALRIVVSNDRGALKRLSPEIRQVTKELLDKWTMPSQAKKSAAKPKPRRKPSARRRG